MRCLFLSAARRRAFFARAAILSAALPAAALSACGSGDKSFSASQPALPVMENIALNARSCWFKSNDARFSSYRLAPELKSYSDKPRILLVPYAAPGERPLLVIEATGNPARVSAYGPLMQTPLAGKINSSLKNWTRQGKKC